MSDWTFVSGPERLWYGEPAKYRSDIVCPQRGEPIPLYSLSISKFTESVCFVHCPDCGVYHQFTTASPAPPNASPSASRPEARSGDRRS